jgi:hypothetical protein
MPLFKHLVANVMRPARRSAKGVLDAQVLRGVSGQVADSKPDILDWFEIPRAKPNGMRATCASCNADSAC